MKGEGKSSRPDITIAIDTRLATTFALVGATYLLQRLYSILRLFLELTVIPGTNVKTFQSRHQGTKTWAIVTGVTSGLGVEFARQLAAKGYCVVLVARRRAAMEELAEELSTKYSISTKIIVMDFSDPSSRSQACAELSAFCAMHDPGVLINNAGVSHEMPEPFVETDPLVIDQIVQTNVLGTLQLTRAVLPHMIARSKGKGSKSLVLNVGSLDGRLPAPLLAVYCYTKAGLEAWTKALAWEVRSKGVMVQVVLPAFVISNMSKIRKSSLTVPTARKFVRSTLSSLGLPGGAQGRASTMTPYWAHAIMDYATGIFGYSSEMAAMHVSHWMHRDIRRRALAKRARLAKAQ
ncbi:hypothetical protein M231_04968 [Tremella mesenterica]|uniref:Very-long-chain 3-oxoacyl-CoA reductase n=1 Tax=Tremella mesenterica TaxID=5217 RepID=A0A4Q1BJ41_TREME|nr:hypothetical protein M231_04968 [Tremella mesenterica]